MLIVLRQLAEHAGIGNVLGQDSDQDVMIDAGVLTLDIRPDNKRIRRSVAAMYRTAALEPPRPSR